jgi:aspartyl-tRNA(Asn)/glutamyl-tRNA(Gln) amidotransferase subunit B
LKKIKKDLPELPVEKRIRYQKDFGIKDEDIESYINDPVLGAWFEEVLTNLPSSGLTVEAKKAGYPVDSKVISRVSNYITSDLIGLLKLNPNLGLPLAKNFAKLMDLNLKEKITSRATKDILAIIIKTNEDPEVIANREDLIQQNDENKLKIIVQDTISINEKIILDYKNGKENALMALVGQIMKKTKGSANPGIVKQLLIDLLK